MLQTVTLMRPLVAVIEGHDKDLARQIRRAANSVALNLAEAAGSDRGNRKARLHTALGSARETRTGFQLAGDRRALTGLPGNPARAREPGRGDTSMARRRTTWTRPSIGWPR
jgi:hypothetical protein